MKLLPWDALKLAMKMNIISQTSKIFLGKHGINFRNTYPYAYDPNTVLEDDKHKIIITDLFIYLFYKITDKCLNYISPNLYYTYKQACAYI